MQWAVDSSFSNLRVALVTDFYPDWDRVDNHIAEVKQWCRKNKIFYWHDTTLTLRLTSAKNVTLFLLRWS